MPRVLNKRTDHIPESAVYVDRTTKWGNPFVIPRDGTRKEVIKLYTKLTLARLTGSEGKKWDQAIEELRGKDLVCWCRPKLCHADLLLHIANDDCHIGDDWK